MECKTVLQIRNSHFEMPNLVWAECCWDYIFRLKRTLSQRSLVGPLFETLANAGREYMVKRKLRGSSPCLPDFVRRDLSPILVANRIGEW